MWAASIKEALRATHLAALCIRFGGVLTQGLLGWLAIRLIGIAELGTYYLFVAWVAVLSTVLGFGLPELAMRRASELVADGNDGAARSLVTWLLKWSVIAGCAVGSAWWVMAPIAFSYAPQISAQAVDAMRPLGFGVIAFVSTKIVAQALRVRQRGGLGMFFEFVQPFLVVTLAIPAASSFTAPESVLTFAFVAGHISAASIGAAYLLSGWKRSETVPLTRYRGVPFGEVLSLWTAVLVQALFLNAPILALSHFGGTADVGVFGLAARLAAVAMIGNDVIQGYAGPRFAELYRRRDLHSLHRFFRQTRYWSMTYALPVLAVLFVGADMVLRAFGAAHDQGGNILRVLILARAIYAIAGPVPYFLYMTKSPGLETRATLAAAILFVLLTPWQALEPAALWIAISYAVASLVRFGWQYAVVMRRFGRADALA